MRRRYNDARHYELHHELDLQRLRSSACATIRTILGTIRLSRRSVIRTKVSSLRSSRIQTLKSHRQRPRHDPPRPPRCRQDPDRRSRSRSPPMPPLQGLARRTRHRCLKSRRTPQGYPARLTRLESRLPPRPSGRLSRPAQIPGPSPQRPRIHLSPSVGVLPVHPLAYDKPRVETFDLAFQSRIHIALRYGGLTFEAKRSDWKTFLGRCSRKWEEGHADRTAVGKLGEEDRDQMAKKELNGRQIKNAVLTGELTHLPHSVLRSTNALQHKRSRSMRRRPSVRRTSGMCWTLRRASGRI